MTSYDGRRMAWLAGAAVIAAGFVGSGCAPAGSASARLPAWPSSAGPVAREVKTTAGGARPASTGRKAKSGPSASERRAEEWRRAIVYGGAAAAGVSAVLGVSFAIVARGKSLEADEKEKALDALGGSNPCEGDHWPRDCTAVRKLRSDATTFLGLTTWSLLYAGVLELAIGIYGKATPRAPVVRSVRLSPTAGAQGATMAVEGSF